jgi:hypothetical protein
VTVDSAEAQPGMTLGSRATIETGPDSFCEIVYNDKNAMRIAQNARATIDFGKSVTNIDLDRGGVTSVLRKLEKVVGTDSYRIRTKNASAGVRGTSFCVWADEKSLYVCACNGTVRTIDAKGGNELTLTSAHHLGKLYTLAGDRIGAEAAGVLYHTDESVESLAARIGEKIDWTKADE